MASSRLVLDRLLQRFTPALDPGFAPAPEPLAEGLWCLDRRLRLFGALVPCRTVLARVANGDLAMLGAPALASACAADVAKLGRVALVVAPNSFHHLYAAEAVAAFPSAELVAAPGLAQRVPTLPPALGVERLDAPPCAPDLEHAVFGPVRGLAEILFYHAPSRALVVTDLASNLARYEGSIDRWLRPLYGIGMEFGPSRNARALLRADRDASRRVLRRALEWPFERIVVAHGESVETRARERFAEAFAAFL